MGTGVKPGAIARELYFSVAIALLVAIIIATIIVDNLVNNAAEHQTRNHGANIYIAMVAVVSMVAGIPIAAIMAGIAIVTIVVARIPTPEMAGLLSIVSATVMSRTLVTARMALTFIADLAAVVRGVVAAVAGIASGRLRQRAAS